MALVDTPTNNLQEHFAWFNSQKPQIPPGGEKLHYSQLPPATISNIPTTIPINPSSQQVALDVQRSSNPSTQIPATMPEHTDMRNSISIAPRRSEPKPESEDVEIVSFETAGDSSTIVGNYSVERIGNDANSEGILLYHRRLIKRNASSGKLFHRYHIIKPRND